MGEERLEDFFQQKCRFFFSQALIFDNSLKIVPKGLLRGSSNQLFLYDQNYLEVDFGKMRVLFLNLTRNFDTILFDFFARKCKRKSAHYNGH